jgi:hypothetical protein
MPTQTDDDVYFGGRVQFAREVGLPTASIGDEQVSASSPLGATKTIHRFAQSLAQAHGTAATTERRVIHRARAAGTITSFVAGLSVAHTGAATVTANLLKNGTTVLSAVITQNNALAAYAVLTGGISSASYIAGDVFEVALIATAGGGTLGQGVFAQGIFDEAA